MLSGRFNVNQAVAMTIGQLAALGFHARDYSSELDKYNGRKHVYVEQRRVRSVSAKERVIHLKRFLRKPISRPANNLDKLRDRNVVARGNDRAHDIRKLIARLELDEKQDGDILPALRSDHGIDECGDDARS